MTLTDEILNVLRGPSARAIVRRHQAAIPVVEDLPIKPRVGEEVYFYWRSADVLQHLIYLPSGTDPTYPWKPIGMAETISRIDTDSTTTTVSGTTPVDLASTVGPSITLPLTGIWLFDFGCETYDSATANQTTFTWITLNRAGTFTPVYAIDTFTSAINAVGGGGIANSVAFAAAKGDEIRMRYSLNAAGTGHWRERWLKGRMARVQR